MNLYKFKNRLKTLKPGYGFIKESQGGLIKNVRATGRRRIKFSKIRGFR